MTVSAEDLQKFADLFAGLTRAYGRYVSRNDPNKPLAVGDKAKGRATTISEPVTLAHYQRHLEGKQGLGIVPVRENGTAVFGAVDVDSYGDIDHRDMAQRLANNNISAYICKSKSGGAHCYVFAEGPGVLAPKMITHLKAVRPMLGVDIRKAREIFPKQREQSLESIGNWINLPYFGDSRKCTTADGRELTLTEFLETITRLKPGELIGKELSDGVILNELPPCLEKLYLDGIPAGMRNEWGYNMAVYLSKRHQTEHEKIRKEFKMLNQKVCQPPLPQGELTDIADSVLKHEYNYKCTQSPIVEVCDKVLCAQRPYGPQASIRPLDIPEIERIEICGESEGETEYHLKFKEHPEMIRTSQVIEYKQLKKAVCDVAHIYLPDVPQKKWDKYMTTRFPVITITVRAPEERSKRGVLLQALDGWIQQQVRHPEGQIPNNLNMGYPYCDGDFVYIKINDLTLYLRRMNNRLEPSQVVAMLHDEGWEKVDKQFGEQLFEGLWCRPQLLPPKETNHVQPASKTPRDPASDPSGSSGFTPPTADWADFTPSGGPNGTPV